IPYWEAVIHAARSGQAPSLFIGDFNTGRNDLDKAPNGTRFVRADFMDQITTSGYVDLWRVRHPEHREYSWFSPQGQNGFRLDHAFGTEALSQQVLDCRYDHNVRNEGLSDHSALIVDVDLGE
ncbi:MAG: endonuclease/exonuclease/phosphatase family protein, partial [Acetobacteraceae bacterium]